MDRQNLSVDLWGNSGWNNIHYANDITGNDVFMDMLQYVLPCSICRYHTKEYGKIKDTHTFHNEVNVSLNKPIVTEYPKPKIDWIFFHAVTYGYSIYPTDEEKQQYFTFFTAVKSLFFSELEVKLTYFDSRDKLVKWLYNQHVRYGYGPSYNVFNSYYNAFL